MGFPHLWTIIHFIAVAGNKQGPWVDRKSPIIGINFGSVPNPTMKVSTITQQCQETELSQEARSLWALSGIVQNISCLLSFSFLLARIIIWMKGSKIYWLWPCSLSYFDHPMAERNCTSECQSHHGNEIVLILAVTTLSPGRQYYYFSAECNFSVVLALKKENRGHFIFGMAGVYLFAYPVHACPFQHSLHHTDIFPPCSTTS